MELLGYFCLLNIAVMAVDSFQPNCDTNNQFRFHCFHIEHCNSYNCNNNNCGRFKGKSKIVRVKETKIIPKCAFTNSDALRHIIAKNSNIKVVASGSFVNLSNLDTINLSFNVITQLHSGTFNNVSATSLDLSWNKLVYIQEGAFHGLHNLRFLNLSKNELSSISINQMPLFLTELNLSFNLFRRILLTSKRTPSLTDLDLSYNRLKKVALSFENHMKKIDLTQNQLSKLDFFDISSCEELKIASNRFSRVPEPLTYMSVKQVSLYPNPWKCDELQNLWVQLQNNFVNLLDETPMQSRDTSPICVASNVAAIRLTASFEKLLKTCENDKQCDENMMCRNNLCLDPCKENVCDPTSVCVMINHQFHCTCPGNKRRDPKEVYSPCMDVECFTNKDCFLSGYCNGENKCINYVVHGFGGPSGKATGDSGSTLYIPDCVIGDSQRCPSLCGNQSCNAEGSWSCGYPTVPVIDDHDNDDDDNEDDMWWTYEIPKSSPTHKGTIPV